MKIYTEKDIKKLEFHESLIKGVEFDRKGRLNSKLKFDILYISKWIKPKKGKNYFTFIKNKGILEFHHVTRLDIVLKWYKDKLNYHLDDFRIDEIKYNAKTNSTGKNFFECEIIPHDIEGSIKFNATGFKLVLGEGYKDNG